MRPMYAPPLPTLFRFLYLPTEIRLIIYGFCLCAKGCFVETASWLPSYTTTTELSKSLSLSSEGQHCYAHVAYSATKPLQLSTLKSIPLHDLRARKPMAIQIQKAFRDAQAPQPRFVDKVNWPGWLTHAGKNNARLIHSIAESCPQIRTFAF